MKWILISLVSLLAGNLLKASDKHFVIITPSYNNSSYCKENLRSILTQNYPHFRVIYIDDCSTDDTAETVEKYVKDFFPQSPFTLIKNKKRVGALANLYAAIHSCADDEIVVTVDGDDFLAHSDVLSKLNTVYTDPNIWLTYGNFVNYPSYKQEWEICQEIPKHIIKNNRFRNYPWVSSHLRTFYAGLFKRIQMKDLLYEGTFFSMTWDLAIMFPMLEMAGERHQFIPDILYIYNAVNPLSDFRVDRGFQWQCECYIRSLPRYTRINSLQTSEYGSADLVIFSFNRPLQLYALLETCYHHMHNLRAIQIIYRTNSPEYEEGYFEVKNNFPKAHFIKQSDQPYSDFQPLVMDILETSPAEYIIFAVDDMIIIDDVDIKDCIQKLESTKAYGFYLAHSDTLDYCYMLYKDQGIPPCIAIGSDVCMWQFKQGEGDWAYPNSLDMVLYRKSEVAEALSALRFPNPNGLESAWSMQANLNKFGLFYRSAKALNIPLNLVNLSSNRCLHTLSTEYLLHRFQEGYKIDTAPLFQIPHRARHFDYAPQFIPR